MALKQKREDENSSAPLPTAYRLRPTAAKRVCEARWLGLTAYADGLRLQEQAVEQLRAGTGAEQLLLLEHPHVFTLGRGASAAHILAGREQLNERSVEVFETGRGGDVTYHGPGQLVAYPIVNLKPDRCDVHRYVRDLEEVLIRTIRDYGIEGERIAGLTGVWVGNEKIAAIGVRIARWITSHGIALNVNTDLSYFRMIVPCGITDKGVTSISRLTRREVDIREVARAFARHFGEVFEREVTLTL
ncbi:MAG TPA: lipoyl(octanoyl) transferase LipB [Blastocatellia bacterium]|nr:lipoyl(octanoyl) transferase LipB [Blastocatellia bacterium]